MAFGDDDMDAEDRLPLSPLSTDHVLIHRDWTLRGHVWPRARAEHHSIQPSWSSAFFRSPRAEGFAENWAQLSLLRDIVVTAAEAVQPFFVDGWDHDPIENHEEFMISD